MVHSWWAGSDDKDCIKSIEYNCKMFAYEDSDFLGCGIELLGEFFTVFQRTVVLSSSW